MIQQKCSKIINSTLAHLHSRDAFNYSIKASCNMVKHGFECGFLFCVFCAWSVWPSPLWLGRVMCFTCCYGQHAGSYHLIKEKHRCVRDLRGHSNRCPLLCLCLITVSLTIELVVFTCAFFCLIKTAFWWCLLCHICKSMKYVMKPVVWNIFSHSLWATFTYTSSKVWNN